MTRRTSASYDMMHRSSTGKMGGGNNTDLERFSNGDTTKRESSRKRKEFDEMSSASYDSKVVRLTSPMASNSSFIGQYAGDRGGAGDPEKRSVRQNHSEIEKRRRNKMNNYINELSLLIPTCVAMSRKMDKLTVLRLAVQHVKSLRGSIHAYSESSPRPSNLSDSDLISLILNSAPDEAGFLFVVDTARGRILYVSESVSKVLNYTQRDLFGQSLFDVLHPKDIAKVKEQLSSSVVSQSRDNRILETNKFLKGSKLQVQNNASANSDSMGTGVGASVSSLPWLCPGARRSFFCRMKVKPGMVLKEEAEKDSYSRRKRLNGDKRYCVIQCTGYLKSWSSSNSSGVNYTSTDEDDQDHETSNNGSDPHKNLDSSLNGAMDCLVAVGRLQSLLNKSVEDAVNRGLEVVPGVEFSARHSMDGMFSFIDSKATPILGYLPQELLGSSVYEHVLYDDIPGLVEGHRRALKTKEEVKVASIKFRCKDGRFVSLQSTWKQFQNPWSKEIDFIVAKYIMCNPESSDSKVQPLIMGQSTFSVASDLNFFSCDSNEGYNSATPSRPTSSLGKNIQDVVTSHIEASRIGKLIVEEMKNGCSASNLLEGDSSSNTSPLSALLMQNNTSPNNVGIPGNENSNSGLDNIPMNPNSANSAPGTLNAHRSRNSSFSSNLGYSGHSGLQSNKGMEASPQSSEDNDDATMAVIMSLLEADGGLGGPVDVSTFPWPLT